ncbi:MAG: hypothetical protein QOK36_1551 [Gaiellales bacterium]|nr:hypothetical protein [Gaiellales bacterium]
MLTHTSGVIECPKERRHLGASRDGAHGATRGAGSPSGAIAQKRLTRKPSPGRSRFVPLLFPLPNHLAGVAALRPRRTLDLQRPPRTGIVVRVERPLEECLAQRPTVR